MTSPHSRSFLEIPPDSPFPLQNLPYGVFRPPRGGDPRPAVAIGDHCLDLRVVEEAGLLSHALQAEPPFFQGNSLNPLMERGARVWTRLRQRLQELLSESCQELQSRQSIRDEALLPLDQIESCLPVEIGDYTDFYSSREHARNVGTMFRGEENALLPNWLHLPVAYHGRSSSIVVSGSPIVRPKGQIRGDDQERPRYAPTQLLDFELEMGFLVGPASELGRPVPIGKARDHVFGLLLVNDWSARDIQRWEYVPLGPFLGKNFATTLSPWIVTLEALEPFRCQGPRQDPEPLEHLKQPQLDSFDIQLEVFLQSPGMLEGQSICRSNYRYLYWSLSQQLAHHTSNGCNLRTGDLMASGTISGSDPTSFGSLLELTWKGTKPIEMADGSQRRFLEDRDRLTLTAWCQGDGYRVGFGECSGVILPALG